MRRTYSKNPTGGRTPISFSGAMAFSDDAFEIVLRSTGTKAVTEAAMIIAIRIDLIILSFLLWLAFEQLYQTS
jgi:hypothetical protein